MKKLSALLLVASWLSVTLSGCAGTKSVDSVNSAVKNVSNETKDKSNSIRLGYQKGGAVPIAKQRGELEKKLAAQNIKVEWAGPFDRCASLLQAISANQADIGGCGDIPGLSAIAAGQEICIGAVQRPRPEALGSAIVVRGNSNIKKPADLVGKKVAVNQAGAGEYLLLKVLEKEKISKDKVQRVFLGPTDAGPALYQGTVDAWAVWEPYVSLAVLEHGARRITTTHPAPTYSVMLVRNDTAAKSPKAVQAAFSALGEEYAWLNKNAAKSAEFLVKDIKISPAVAKQVTDNQGPQELATPNADDVAKIQKTADWMLAQKILPKKVDVAAVVCPTAK
ncbi:aliphatic sulfonate ABC transporter substrate-binding protein [Calothrix sp. PCC 7507]|uniref:aliphatic sulfonate ABC transporter substrate-binding protein n=1 Tax=Calothrix sp. PCC 7507 TaxID=99598 RepID=UPI00029F21D8|nr:aliphatic sulfonate ABC transporter substrate-binding protein [Calothrix sp. PCC 7507]AFY34849.1 aliphatic sulfonates family ABC transporter, periplasmic ligand-binding protein [Calothrix sp. PCC 7507]